MNDGTSQQERTQNFRNKYGPLWKTKTSFGQLQNSMNDPIELAISVTDNSFSVEQIHQFLDDPLVALVRVREHLKRLSGKKDDTNPYNGGKPALYMIDSGLYRRTEEGDRMAAEMIEKYIHSGNPVPPCCEKLVSTIRSRLENGRIPEQRNDSPKASKPRSKARIVLGTVRSPDKYTDGTPRLEIWINKAESARLPIRLERAVPITLVIGRNRYKAKLRSTAKNPYIWISPDLIDATGRGTRLAYVLPSEGFEKNEQVKLKVRGKVLRLSPSGGRTHNEIVNEDDESAFPEGREYFRLHRFHERDSRITRKAKAKRLCETGKLECEICGFDFLRIYGLLGKGFIEAHHTVPIASLEGKTATKISDIALVCSNCHRMLHRGAELSVSQLRKRLLRREKIR